MTHTPTPEQAAVVEFVTTQSDNLLINALAGAAKTSTLILIAEALPAKTILSLAFNKKIADEMKSRLPTNCTSMTLNSCGYRAWSSFLRKRLSLDTRKTSTLINTWIKENIHEQDRDEFYSETYDDLREIVNAISLSGWVPKSFRGPIPLRSLVDDEDFFIAQGIEEDGTLQDAAIWIACESLRLSMQGTLDYDDMIYLPTVGPVTFPPFDIVLIDEAQDLSPINHVLLRKIKGRARLIAVGDPNQAIYGFRGADTSSMANMQQMFSMTERILSISFRCPIAVVAEARSRAPAMQYPAWAKEGRVTHLAKWKMADVPEDIVILCRNNAPLFRMALELIKAGRFPELVGSDISKRLRKLLSSMGAPEMTSDELCAAIDHWAEKEKQKKRKSSSTADIRDCLLVFAEAAVNLEAALAHLDHLMNATGPVKLMTGHKSKGLEYPNVLILNRELLNPQKNPQDANLLYVMQTRAMHQLFYATLTDFNG